MSNDLVLHSPHGEVALKGPQMVKDPDKSQLKDPSNEPVEHTTPARWTDLLWMPLFICLLAGYLVVCVIDLHDYVRTKCYLVDNFDDAVRLFDLQCLFVMVAGVCGAVLLSAMLYIILCLFTSQFVVISMVIQISVSIGTMVMSIINNDWLTMFLSVVWILFSALVYWILRRRISHAARTLEAVVSVAKKTPSIIITSLLGSLLSAGISVLSGLVMMAGYAKNYSSECSAAHRARTQPELVGILIYVFFVNTLINGVIKAVVRTSICCVYGWWFYRGQQPKYPLLGGLKRAFTYNFGSLVFACFVLSVGVLVVHILSSLSHLFTGTGSKISIIMISLLVTHGVTVADWLLGHFNNYTFVYISLYNHSYIGACSNAIELLRVQGFKALTNDCLAGGVFTFSSWCIGSVTGLICYIYLKHIIPYPVEGIPFILSYVVMLGTQVGSVFTSCISCGVQALFVASAIDPQVLAQTHPDVFLSLCQATIEDHNRESPDSSPSVCSSPPSAPLRTSASATPLP